MTNAPGESPARFYLIWVYVLRSYQIHARSANPFLLATGNWQLATGNWLLATGY
jgi:hypothetical protein